MTFWITFFAGLALGMLLIIGLLFGVMVFESRPWKR